ncbi:MAG: segregation/condensation protein A [Anaerolineales bacterium]|jgi:segregation and condensation protein A
MNLQSPEYTVQLPVFEGPLDLLLHLIERSELDITRVALAQVTGQFLDYLHSIHEKRLDEVAAFLAIAAKLIQIKSEALLPQPPVRAPGEEDPGEALARQLRLYREFKKAAGFLGARQESGLRTYIRLAVPVRLPPRLDLSGLTLEDLFRAAAMGLSRKPELRPLSMVVSAPRVTIREQIRHIAESIRRDGRAFFHRLVGGFHTRMEVVVAFLAMLELVKRRQVILRQSDLFGEIELLPTETWDDNAEFELEFGE